MMHVRLHCVPECTHALRMRSVWCNIAQYDAHALHLTPPPPSANESLGYEELKRRTTIAERMTNLGAIKLSTPPRFNRMQ